MILLRWSRPWWWLVPTRADRPGHGRGSLKREPMDPDTAVARLNGSRWDGTQPWLAQTEADEPGHGCGSSKRKPMGRDTAMARSKAACLTAPPRPSDWPVTVPSVLLNNSRVVAREKKTRKPALSSPQLSLYFDLLMTISPNTTMHELLEIYPGAQRALFRKYHIGGCASCGFRPEETLAQVCERNEQLPVDEVIRHLDVSRDEDSKMQIAPAELAEHLRSGDGLKLVDVRTHEEFDAAHIDGSTLFSQELM